MDYSTQLLGDIVATDFRTASLFKEAGLDFCCGGKKPLDMACAEKGIDVHALIHQLTELQQSASAPAQTFNEWDLAFLCDYIVNTHHRYVTKTLPEICFYTLKIARVHGDHHPELLEVESLFSQINVELIQHLRNEEEVLFPAIRRALKDGSTEAKAIIHSEINRMNGEHEFAGGAMDKINEITQNYTIPDDGCNTYHVTFKLLEQFEDDLHIHVHLENNILFKKALSL